MPIYVQVDYNPYTSPIGTVQSCLLFKRAVATPGSPQKINGIASASCFSAVSALIRGEPQMIFGNSRNKVPFSAQGVACVHGECNAIWEAMHLADPEMPTVLEMYIEMHPCDKCEPFLRNALPANQIVYYSFPYTPDGVAAWTAAAHALCQ